MALRNWFIPHKDTHKKAYLISWEALLIYILLFIFLQVGFSIVGYTKGGVLGITGNIDQKKIIELTNKEREKKGLPDVVENEALDKAAQMKAQNMFVENYWAHFAPSGKSPWDFILGSGYKFTYAGENLAKNFYNSDDVVSAWMASPTHKDNLLNSKYQDIGIAVVDGVLNGQKTTLVVQEFGTTQNVSPQPIVDLSGKKNIVSVEDYNQKPELVQSVQTPEIGKSLIDPYKFSKTAAVTLISFMGILLALDMIILYKRGVFRLTSHYLAHMSLLTVTLASILSSHSGAIL